MSSQVGEIAARLRPYGTPLFLMPYAYPLSFAMQKPTVDYVETLTRKGLEHMTTGQLSGVVLYKLALVPQDPAWTRPVADNLARTGDGRLSFALQEGTPTTAGMWCAASRTIKPDPAATSHRIGFWHTDSRGPGNPVDFHVKQLLLDGQVIWQGDVAADVANAWQQVTVDLTAKLAGKASAVLQWRLYERKGVSSYPVDAGVDDITATGFTLSDPGVENAGHWTPNLARSGGPVYCSAQVYHQNYAADLSARIATLYGATG
jgi:hypothetical protein